MILHPPFSISSRLLPALVVGGATISFERGQFIIDLPDGTEHTVTDLHPPRGRVKGHNDTPERLLASMFGALLSFLSACAESRAYARRRGKDEMEGDNSDLFPSHVGEWAESCSDDLSCLQLEIEESDHDLIEP